MSKDAIARGQGIRCNAWADSTWLRSLRRERSVGRLGYFCGPGLVEATVRLLGFSRRTDVAVAVSHRWAVRFHWHVVFCTARVVAS